VLSETTREGVCFAADRIREGVLRLSEKIQHPLDISIGVALYPEHGDSIDKLILLADRALYIAKKGGGKVHIGEDVYPVNEKSVDIIFQPVMDTRSDQILGYEALSRDPSGKLSILELFKRYQAVGQLNQLKCLCFHLQLERAKALGIQKVFINVDFNMLNQLESVQKPDGIDVILEISEGEALYEVERFLETARRWRALGFKFAIDDFGAGFISLPFVARLIPDYIKMDRSTIVQAASSEQFGNFLKDLVLALRNYSKEGIIAEGIENEKELKVAKRIGGFLVQGYLWGKEKNLS
jgi:EAL domain-containing protein (putative c-di-GMP-specific phosphodiesterase class I)